MRFLNSVYSDPVGSAVDTGTKLLGALDQHEQSKVQSKVQRQIQEMQLKKLQREDVASQQSLAMSGELIKRLSKQQNDLGGMRADDMYTLDAYLPAALQKSNEADKTGKPAKLTTNDINAGMTVFAHTPIFTKDPEKIGEQAEAFGVLNKAYKQYGGMIRPGQKIRVNDPQVLKAANIAWQNQINEGTDKFGNTAANGVNKKLNGIYLDVTGEVPLIAMTVEVESPVKDGQVYTHVGDGRAHYMAPSNPTPAGLVQQGNIDLNQRKVRRNVDEQGNVSVSTVESVDMSFDEGGKRVHVVLPTIDENGNRISAKEAGDRYKKDGKHLAKFDSQIAASRYAESLHSDSIWEADKKKYVVDQENGIHRYTAPVTMGRGGEDSGVIVQMPAPLAQAQTTKAEETLSLVQKIRAISDPIGFAKELEDKITNATNDRRAMAVLQSVPKELWAADKGTERYNWLLPKKPEGVSMEKWHGYIKPTGLEEKHVEAVAKAKELSVEKEKDRTLREKMGRDKIEADKEKTKLLIDAKKEISAGTRQVGNMFKEAEQARKKEQDFRHEVDKLDRDKTHDLEMIQGKNEEAQLKKKWVRKKYEKADSLMRGDNPQATDYAHAKGLAEKLTLEEADELMKDTAKKEVDVMDAIKKRKQKGYENKTKEYNDNIAMEEAKKKATKKAQEAADKLGFKF